MEDIPVDISNKKYFSSNESVKSDLTSEVVIPIIKEVQNKPLPSVKLKTTVKRKALIVSLKSFRLWIAQKVERFKKIQYPYLYEKFYDIYHFELVGYKPLDISLKILVIVTILILLGILLMVLRELLNLAL